MPKISLKTQKKSIDYQPLNGLSEGDRKKSWEGDIRTFDEKNHEWNSAFWNHLQNKTVQGAESLDELTETLNWVGIDIKSNKTDDHGLHTGIEEFRKNYVPGEKSDIEKFVTDIAINCHTDGTLNLETLQQRIELLQNKGFLSVFGKTPEVRTLIQNHAIAHGLLLQSEKRNSSLPLVPVVSGTLSLILFFLLANSLYATLRSNQQVQTSQQVLGIEDQQKQAFPVRLKIPKININAAIEYVGLTSKGEMGVPDNTVNVGWFSLGSKPGEKGNAVIAGHLFGERGEAGVFTDLDKLKKGDVVYVQDNKGESIVFVVREIRTYNPGYAREVFNQSDKIHLNLITCDGVWNEDKKSYSKRLVVFTDLLEKNVTNL